MNYLDKEVWISIYKNVESRQLSNSVGGTNVMVF